MKLRRPSVTDFHTPGAFHMLLGGGGGGGGVSSCHPGKGRNEESGRANQTGESPGPSAQ